MPPMNLQQAMKEYGYVGSLANNIPELKALLLKAAKGGWSVDEFARSLQDTKWWKNSSDKVKQYTILQTTKPGEFKAQRNDWITKVNLAAAKLGVGYRLAGKAGQYADLAMKLGWDDAELSRHLAGLIDTKAGQLGGDAGSVQQSVKKMFADYGVKYSNAQSLVWARNVLSGADTIERLQAKLITQAKSKYAAFSDDLDRGMTIRDIADPYRQAMAQTLELNDADVDIFDPKIQSALSVRDPKTNMPTSKPLWQFEQDLKEDPRWDKTKQATNAAYDQAMRIGKAWGFVG